MALAVALARGGRVRVPKQMETVCKQLQEVYKQVLASDTQPTSELALVVCFFTLQDVMLEVAACRTLQQSDASGLFRQSFSAAKSFL